LEFRNFEIQSANHKIPKSLNQQLIILYVFSEDDIRCEVKE